MKHRRSKGEKFLKNDVQNLKFNIFWNISVVIGAQPLLLAQKIRI